MTREEQAKHRGTAALVVKWLRECSTSLVGEDGVEAARVAACVANLFGIDSTVELLRPRVAAPMPEEEELCSKR